MATTLSFPLLLLITHRNSPIILLSLGNMTVIGYEYII